MEYANVPSGFSEIESSDSFFSQFKHLETVN